MKKILTAFVLASALIAATAPQAFALDIRITPQGYIQFYQDGVLGEKTEIKTEEKSTDARQQEERRRAEAAAKETKAIRTINTSENKQLRISTDKREVKVELTDKKPTSTEIHKPTETQLTQPVEGEHSEKIDTKRVNLEFPAALHTEEQKLKADVTKVEQKIEDKVDQKVNQVETKVEDKTSDYGKKIEAERQQREQELVQLKTKLEDGAQHLELTSRDVKAKIEDGAEFALDPTTNQVTITTPSGQEHVLTHLPDQAIERMKAVGLLTSKDANTTEVEVKTTDDGKVVYETKDVKEKRLFGIFKRKINTTVSLDDTTGEVTETEETPKSLLGQFLNSVSF